MYYAVFLFMLKFAWQWLDKIAIAITVIESFMLIIYNYRFFLEIGVPFAICTLGWLSESWQWSLWQCIAFAIVILITAIVVTIVLYMVFIRGDVGTTICNWLISDARKYRNKAAEQKGYDCLAMISTFRKAVEGDGYDCVAMISCFCCNYKKAIQYHNRCLTLAKETGDRVTEGRMYSKLVYDFYMLGDLKAAIDYARQHLSIVEELKNKAEERQGNEILYDLYENLGIAYVILGDCKKARECHEVQLYIAETNLFTRDLYEKGLIEKGRAHKNIGNVYYHQGDFTSAIHHYNEQFTAADVLVNKAEKRDAYGNLGEAYYRLLDFQRASEYHELHLAKAKKWGDKAGEGRAYGNLGCVYVARRDFKKAIECHNLHLRIAKEVGEQAAEATAYHELGYSFELLDLLPEALDYYRFSVTIFNRVRDRFQSKDEWKISLRNEYKVACSGLWRVLLKQDKVFEALVAAEKGRAQALTDLVESRYGILTSQSAGACRQQEISLDGLHGFITSSTAFQAVDRGTINNWVLSEERNVDFRKHELDNPFSLHDAKTAYRSLIEAAYKEIGVGVGVRCENRSLDTISNDCIDERSGEERSQHPLQQDSSLVTLYNIAIKPFADLVQGEELVIVPDGPLWLAPYAVFVDSNSKYLCESLRIRLIPSLTSLKMIANCPEGYHRENGALLVGDPWVAEVTDSKGEKLLEQLAFAKQEVEMIGEIIRVTPLIAKEATKAEVMKRLGSVALIHIAAHGRLETGEIALSPDPERVSLILTRDDYILTMADVLSAHLRARLVVLSSCHSARNEILDEGVVGIAHAFIGAGARSVLVSLWAIDDEATLEFMRLFYHHLVQGRSASESLNQAMKYLRESDEYSGVKYWAPFVLIGDDVTLEFDE